MQAIKAIKAIKRQFQARRLNPQLMPRKVIRAAAEDYLRDHPELIEQVAETVRNNPELRTLYEKEQRGLIGNRP